MSPKSTLPLTCLVVTLLICVAPPAVAKGGFQELTLRYVGSLEDAHVTVEQTTQGGSNIPFAEKTKTVIFDGVVQPGDEIVLAGADRHGTLGPVVRIRVNGKMNASVRTNCSLDLVEGLGFGDFEVMSAVSDCTSSDDDEDDDGDDGGDQGDDGGEDPDCAECDGQVTELTLLYHGDEEVMVEVTQRYKSEEITVFEGLVEPDTPFSFEGENRRGTFGAKIFIYVEGRFHAEIHTSCSEPIGPGTVAGDFEVVEGESRHGGRLCPLEDGDGEMSCAECEGQVTELTLRYNGESEATIKVIQRVKGQNVILFLDDVEPGDPFTIYGGRRDGRMGSKIKLYVDRSGAGEIHTSCSEPIGPGLVVGDFEVLDGSSRRGGRLCPLPDGE